MNSINIQLSDNGGFVLTINREIKNIRPERGRMPQETINPMGGRTDQKMLTATSVDDAVNIVRNKLLEMQS